MSVSWERFKSHVGHGLVLVQDSLNMSVVKLYCVECSQDVEEFKCAEEPDDHVEIVPEVPDW